MQKQLGFALILIGVIMFVYGTSVSLGFVIVIIQDDTPPIIVQTTPADGETYSSLNALYVSVKDEESGVKDVIAWVDTSGNLYELSLSSGTIYGGVWTTSIPPLSEGDHTVKFAAGNNDGLSSSTPWLSFTIYTELQGKWYINNIEITSPTQILRLTTRTLDFKFMITSGTVTSCRVSWEGPETGSRPLVLLGTNLTGSHTFAKSGTYTMTLTVSDGTSQVTMEIWGVNLGGEAGWGGIEFNMWQWTGLALVGVGSIFTWKGKSKQEA